MCQIALPLVQTDTGNYGHWEHGEGKCLQRGGQLEQRDLFFFFWAFHNFQLWWANPGQQVSTNLATHSCPCSFTSMLGQRARRKKWENLRAERQFNKWRGRGKKNQIKMEPSDAKAETHHLPQADQCSGILWATTNLEDTPLSLASSTTTFITVFDAAWYRIPPWTIHISCPCCVPPVNFLPLFTQESECRVGNKRKFRYSQNSDAGATNHSTIGAVTKKVVPYMQNKNRDHLKRLEEILKLEYFGVVWMISFCKLLSHTLGSWNCHRN